jgi:hypothetical protein
MNLTKVMFIWNLTLRSIRYCIISFVEYKLSNFNRQWWRIWIVKNTNIYSLPAKNFSQILNINQWFFIFHFDWKLIIYFKRDISSVINWKPSLSQFSGIYVNILCVFKWCNNFGSWRNSCWAILATWYRCLKYVIDISVHWFILTYLRGKLYDELIE